MYDPKYEIVICCKAIIAHGKAICNMIDFPLEFRASELNWHLKMIDELSTVLRLLQEQFTEYSFELVNNFLGNSRYIRLKYEASQRTGKVNTDGLKPVIEQLEGLQDELIKSFGRCYETSYMDKLND